MTARAWAHAVARCACGEATALPEVAELAAFQERAASRLVAMIGRWGGALLADAVGLGKTRVALVVAAAISRAQRVDGIRPVVAFVVPARLRATWRAAAQDAGLSDFEVVTHAQLSRGPQMELRPTLVVVDEAHRFRNDTARRRNLGAWTGAPMLLVTATPIANSVDDLWNLLSLFLDDRDVRSAFGWELATARWLAANGEWEPLELVREVTVRRTSPPSNDRFGRRPAAAFRVLRYEPDASEAWLWANLEEQVRQLTTFRATHHWPHGLFVEHMLRRWESGPHALAQTIAELQLYMQRALDAARAGRPLDRSSFRALFGAQPAQEVLAFLYEDATGSPLEPEEVEGDIARIDALARQVDALCRNGSGRERALVDLARDGEPLLVFTSFRSAARGMFERLRADLGPRATVGLLTGTAARATGVGRLPAHELLARFAPRSHGVTLPQHQRVQVLVATDCISEGVNLQDCGRVVLADLPYSPLAVEQRVGRLLRPGGPHAQVEVILPRPHHWNDSLGLRRRLDRKIAVARDHGFANAANDPLADWTTLERIAGLLPDAAELPRAAKLTATPNVWLCLAEISGRVWMFVVGARDFVALLSDLVWDERPLQRCDVPEVVRAAVDARAESLRAALLAPSTIGLDAPQARAWRLLTASHNGSPVALHALRERLIQPHPVAIERSLTRLVEASDVEQLRRLLATLPPPSTPEVRLISTLGIEANKEGKNE